LILYQDSDSICKRYLTDEIGIAETQAAMAAADYLATSLIAYAEVRGVLARARRGRRIRSNRQYARVSAEFEEDWSDYYQIAVSPELVKEAGRLAEQHSLTGVDALHVASAAALRDRVPDRIEISTWDWQSGLISALVAEGLVLAHEVNG
jgi:predicted nucleic acid-binding protein